MTAPAAAVRERWKPGTLIYPLPAVLVSCGATPEEYNLLTVAWTGTVCTNPPMCSISLRPERHSYEIIRRTGAFVINLTTQALARATDWCGVRSGRDCDKFREAGLTPLPSDRVEAPLVAESPVNIECRVRQRLPLGSHDLFLAEVVGVQVDPAYIDPATGRFDLERAGLIAYSHGEYFALGRSLGRFGWSVRKNPARRPKAVRRESRSRNRRAGSASSGRRRRHELYGAGAAGARTLRRGAVGRCLRCGAVPRCPGKATWGCCGARPLRRASQLCCERYSLGVWPVTFLKRRVKCCGYWNPSA